MRNIYLVAAAVIVAVTVGAAATIFRGNPVPENVVATLEGDPDRGAYFARLAGCIACHTNESGGGDLLAGGPPLKTPFGTFYGPNITPDPATGLGAWSLNDFARALRHGISPEGEPYYPAFPYTFYSKFTDQDIADLWAAMKTVPNADTPSKPQDLKFPFDQRWALRGWQNLFFDSETFQDDPTRSESWNRGKYIVTGPAHCGACHTPRNPLGASDAELALHGAGGLPGGERSPPITPSVLGERGWTENNLAFGLRFGTKPNGDVLGGSMGEVIRDGTSWLFDEDLRAIAHYLLNNDDTE
ncbi:MAG: cytochrome c [Rhodospirillaceae bacterium]|jgi:mono/diheme cytochrome c family protein|nr:cytochrome c [Rhodospirillales bacterium]MBT3807862.1 cytochrome c [Rhodospirillaceae bacterium]MBT3931908.1 cytochrome c [Rhodospirillaceae bacterium]MBT4772502.1 cytochrome c [Rhodospirillaceae bacterium]MBT5358091.1 cytochrome c [Rhodospirillaceae bacterium]